MIFFFFGLPRALLRYQTSLTWVSFASDPELQKNTFEIGTGAISLSFSANLDRRIVALAGEEMREGKLAHLRGGGFDQFLVAVAERRAPKPGHAFDIGLAVGVVDVNALPAFEDERPGLAKAREIDVGMHQGFYVAGGEIAERRWHGSLVVVWPGIGRFLVVIYSPIVAAAVNVSEGKSSHAVRA